MTGKLLSIEEISALISYDPVTGALAWKRAPRRGIACGAPIIAKNTFGYIQVVIQRRPYLGHRIALGFSLGRWPSIVDHINGDPADNRLCNLRECTGAQNQANRGARRDSSTGVRGVRFDKKTGKYAAQIQFGGYDTIDEAAAAYLRMAQLCYGEFAVQKHRGATIFKSNGGVQ